MRVSIIAFAAAALFLLAGATPSAAQPKPPVAAPAIAPPDDDGPAEIAPAPPRAGAGLREWVKGPMRAVDPMTLRAEGSIIRIWGIKPASMSETPIELKALELMDKLIQEQQVTCRIVGGTPIDMIGMCTTSTGQDLALELLKNGYVVVDRRQTYARPQASAYEVEQDRARTAAKGVWSFVKEDTAAVDNDPMAWVKRYSYLLPIALVFGPFGGLAIIGFVAWYWLKRMATVHEQESEQSNRKEAMLINRERHVLISTFEGELTENKNKIEAFLVIYGDMLRGLQDSNEVPKYQQGGDIVQKHPTFGRAVFEANVGKLSLLDIKLAGQISKLYAAMPKEQEYINLEPSVPLETAVKLVEKVLKEAETLLDPINNVILGLQASTARKTAATPQVQG